MEANKGIILLQHVVIDKGTKEAFVQDLLKSKAELGAEHPEGFIFSCGGFKMEAQDHPVFYLLTAWKDEKAEDHFLHTPFYKNHHELFQKFSSHNIETQAIKLWKDPVKPEEKKCLEVFIAHVDSAHQAEFYTALKKLEEAAPKIPGVLSYNSGHTKDSVVTFITWDALSSHENFKKSPEFPTLLAECGKLSPKNDVFHIHL
jgi:heme-degrading monooxygenase HmoA